MPRNLYEVLNVDREDPPEVIRKAYFRLAREKHPDKTGGTTAEEFKEIQKAYEILSDPRRRQIYDATGSDSDNPGGGGGGINPFEEMMRGGGGVPMGFGMDIHDIFGQMFSGGAGGGGPFGGFGGFGGDMGPPEKPQRKGKGPSKQHEIGLTLTEFYKGRDIRIVFNQGRFCYVCKGDGATSFVECPSCKGRGFHVRDVQLHPGMFVRSKVGCDECKGETRKPGPTCTVCSGSKILQREKTLEVKVTPGMRDGLQLQFTGECSDSTEFATPGDVILLLRRSDSLNYGWQGNDLACDLPITWTESVIGFSRTFLDHPSGKSCCVSWSSGILLNGARLKATGWGMPSGKEGFGNLILTVTVQQPEEPVNVGELLTNALAQLSTVVAKETDVKLVRL
jgi:DnaJ-class molecular chaperone